MMERSAAIPDHDACLINYHGFRATCTLFVSKITLGQGNIFKKPASAMGASIQECWNTAMLEIILPLHCFIIPLFHYARVPATNNTL
jgi:hypothetical protein